MKIGIIGWYYRQNIGDERILQCLRWFFNKHEIHVFNIEDAEKKIDEVNTCDYVLLGGGGLLLRGFNKFYRLFDKISRPLGLVGIGVEAINNDMKKTINLLLEKSNFILVRGKSGVDKTTLLKIMGLLKPQTQGKIVLFRKNVHKQKLPAERRAPI